MPTPTIPPVDEPLSTNELRLVGPIFIVVGLVLIALGLVTL